MPWLRALAAKDSSDEARAFTEEWWPTLTLICTRKSDGAAIKVAVFDTPSSDYRDGVGQGPSSQTMGELF